MNKYLILIGLAAVAGCASAPTLEQFQDQCHAYGFYRGTPEFAQCVQSSVQDYNAQVTQRQQAWAAAAAVMNQASQQMQAQQMQQQQLRQQRIQQFQTSTTNCTPTFSGGWTCRTNPW